MRHSTLKKVGEESHWILLENPHISQTNGRDGDREKDS